MNVLRSSRAALGWAALLLALWQGMSAARAGVEVLYATGFELEEGFDAAFELPGQGGWVGDPYDDSPGAINSSGIISNTVAPFQQEAYVGFFAPNPSRSFVSVWPPVNHVPTLKPIVHFEVLMTIASSSTNQPNEDNFRWSVYNIDGERLFTVDFDNFFKDVSYFLDGVSATNVPTLQQFLNDTPFRFSLDMDFEANAWSAAIDGNTFLQDLPITTAGASLTLGDVDAVWAIYEPEAPGDNFMIFDDYRITARPAGTDAAWIEHLGLLGNGLALRLHGPDECRYAIETTTDLRDWTVLKTNVVTAGSFDFVHTPAIAAPMRFYRARFVP